MHYPEVSFDERMATVEFRVGERAHITVDSDVCRSCTTKDCVHACPAGLFVPTTDGGILFNYEQCFECGTCYQVCNARVPLPGPIPLAATASCSGRGDGSMTVIVAAMGWSWQEAGVDPLTGAVSADPHDRGPARADFAALEHALSLAENVGRPGDRGDRRPAEADEMLKDALAAGADRGPPRRAGPPDSGAAPSGLVGGRQNLPAALAGALRERYGVPYLVLCGDRSADRGTGSFPAFLAAALQAAQALGVVRMEPDGDRMLRVHRRLDGGRREVLRVRGPAVVSVEAAGVRLRRASLPATLASRDVAIPVARMAGAAAHRVAVLGAHPYRPRPRELPGPSGTALHRTLELTGALVERTPPTVLGPLSPAEAADELLGYLRRHGYLAPGDARLKGPAAPAPTERAGVYASPGRGFRPVSAGRRAAGRARPVRRRRGRDSGGRDSGEAGRRGRDSGGRDSGGRDSGGRDSGGSALVVNPPP